MISLVQILGRAWRVMVASLTTVVLQVLAIIGLPPVEYGTFVLFYIVLGLGNAAVYSVVCEPWGSASVVSDWDQYSTALVTITLLSWIPTGLIILATGQFLAGVLMGLGVSASLYRLGARYFSVYHRRLGFVAMPDTLSLLLLVGASLVFRGFLPMSVALSGAWALSATVCAAVSERPAVHPRLHPLSNWVSLHWPRIKFLVVDSALTEAGSAGVPLVLAPAMGLANFGVYRSVSSVAVIVRMILNPLRPNLARTPLLRIAQWSTGLALGVGGIILAGGAYFVLLLAGEMEWLRGSTLRVLAEFRLPAAVYVCSNTLSLFYYLALRAKIGGARLIRIRAGQLLVSVVLPIGGFLVGGLGGAIWGYALEGATLALASWWTLRVEARRCSPSL